jgi:hypothetical protein
VVDSDDRRLALTEDEERALIALLKRTIDYEPFPLAPRLDPLKTILAKLESPTPAPRCRRRSAGGWHRATAESAGGERAQRAADDARQRATHSKSEQTK